MICRKAYVMLPVANIFSFHCQSHSFRAQKRGFCALRDNHDLELDPRDNAIAERVNGILKTEWLYDDNFIGFDDGYRRVAEVINLYNNKEMNFKQKKRVACVSRILSFIRLLQKKINLLSKVQSHLEGKDLV